MKSKENKTRPFLLTRSFSHAFGGSRNNVEAHGAAPHQHLHGLPPGSPGCPCYNCIHSHYAAHQEFARQQYYTPSARSSSATSSDVQAPPSSRGSSSTSKSTNTSGSTGTSSHYSGSNSPVYGGPQQTPSPVESPPQIHNLLDSSSAALVWDVRAKPKELPVSGPTSQIISPHVLSFPLIANAPGHIRLISPDFPWTLEIGPKQHGILCSEVLHALYDLLNSELEDVAWSLADERKRSSIVRAWKRRPEAGPRILKVDWLGKHYMFKGIHRDASIKQQLLRPDAADVPETLIVSLGKA